MTLKKFSISFLTSAGFLAVIAVGVLSGNFEGVNTAEAATVSVTGYAWSDNIGWISFNCIDGGPDKNNICKNNDGTDKANYGVFYDDSTGQFSGYAWSDNIGWVYFGPDITGKIISSSAPEIPKQWAKANATIIEGWAIAYRAVEQESQTLGGWDGWMRFDKSGNQTSDSATIVLTEGATRGELHGYVWGGDVVGWMSLSCGEGKEKTGGGVESICTTSNYQVKANLPGSPTLTVEPSTATINIGGTKSFVAWYDSDGSGPSPKSNVTTSAAWTSSATNIATIGSATGVATGVSGGLSTITATYSSLTSQASLTVSGVGTPTLTVEPSTATINIGGTKSFVAWYDSDGSGPSLKSNVTTSAAWTSSATNIATIGSATGVATGVSGGLSTITATYSSLTSQASLTVSGGSGKTLTVIIKGEGTVSSSLGSCKNDDEIDESCPYSNLATNTSYDLTAKAPFGWAFTGWKEGDCSGIAKDCTVTMGDKDETVTATFSEVKIIEI